MPQLFGFIEDLTNLHPSKSRTFLGRGHHSDKIAAYGTLYEGIELSKLMAPFAPFLSEHLYQQLGLC